MHFADNPEKIVCEDRLVVVANILAAGYVRLLQNRQSNRAEVGKPDQTGARNRPPERLDSSGDQRDELETG